ncbi:MAG: T9SS type A sorting domain-containing protein [Bacteroidia bacterium]|nr:T9SS type A sorting domain-containing protein [Bacteroidia bacterium]
MLAGEINYNYPGTNNGKARLIKITSQGKVIWDKKYGGIEMTTLNSVIELADGSIVAVGGNNNTPKYNQAGWIMKTNANGDSLWAIVYDYLPGFPSLFYSLNATSDNGFIIAGSANDTTTSISQQAWILKLDSMGCDSIGCQFVGLKEQQTQAKTLVLFPNPSKGNFTVKSETAFKKCVVMDVLGNIVYNEKNLQGGTTIISLSHLSNGIYFLKITDIHDKEMVSKILIEH